MEIISGQSEFSSKILNHSGFSLVDFWGPNCAPCIGLSKKIKELESKYPELSFFSVNAEEELEIAADLGVRGLPTLIFFRDGKEYDRLIGNIKEFGLISKIEHVLKSL